jgi:hypothetical protein
VATAVIARTTVIVTHNIGDFPPEVLGRYGLAKVWTDGFCVGLPADHETQVLGGICTPRANLGRTPMSPAKYIDHLGEDRWACPGWRSYWHHSTGRYEAGTSLSITIPITARP